MYESKRLHSKDYPPAPSRSSSESDPPSRVFTVNDVRTELDDKPDERIEPDLKPIDSAEASASFVPPPLSSTVASRVRTTDVYPFVKRLSSAKRRFTRP